MSSAYRVRQAKSPADLQQFVGLARRVYASGCPGVLPLDMDVRAALRPDIPLVREGGYVEPLLLEDANGIVVGRATVQGNPRWDAHLGRATAFFGYFEVVPDHLRAGATLLEDIKARARAHGATRLIGPANLTPNQTMGFVLAGYHQRNGVDAVWTHPAYPHLMDAAGFELALRMTTYGVDDLRAVPRSRLLGEARRRELAADGISFRPLERQRLAGELESLRQLINVSFDRPETNPYFVPLTPEEFAFEIGELPRLLVPELVRFVERGGHAVGVALVVPDYNQVVQPLRGEVRNPRIINALWRWKRLDTATLILIALDPAAQGRGIGSALVGDAVETLLRRGYRRLNITWVADANAGSAALWTALGARPLHRVGTYAIAL